MGVEVEGDFLVLTQIRVSIPRPARCSDVRVRYPTAMRIDPPLHKENVD